MMICCNKNKKLKYSSTTRQGAANKNGTADFADYTDLKKTL
jgi:hypothetical protein